MLSMRKPFPDSEKINDHNNYSAMTALWFIIIIDLDLAIMKIVVFRFDQMITYVCVLNSKFLFSYSF